MLDPRIEEAARRRMKVLPSSAPPRPMAPAAPKPTPAPGAPATRPIDAKPGMPTDGSSRQPWQPPAQTPPVGPPVVKPIPGGPGMGAPAGPGNAPGVTAGPEPTSQDDIDQMIRDRVTRELGGDGVNTAEQEALIREQMQGVEGAGKVNARARAGRSGFASSGALAATEGDIARQARMAATEQILGERRSAREEQFGREGEAIDSEMGMRRAAADEEINRRLLEMLGMEGEADAGNAGAPAGTEDLLRGVAEGAGSRTEKPPTATAGGSRPVVSAPPAGHRLYQKLSNGDELWISPNDPGDNSTVVIVKKGA